MNSIRSQYEGVKPVIIPAKKLKKKRRHSQGIKHLQTAERHHSRAHHRLLQAIEQGMGNYRKARDKSSNKKRDGAMRDLSPNMAKAIGKTLSKASSVPNDLAKIGRGSKLERRVWRAVRRASRMAS